MKKAIWIFAACMLIGTYKTFAKSNKNPNVLKSKELQELIKEREINEIVVLGFWAERDVYKTLCYGKGKGYKMSFVSDAIYGYSDKSTDKALNKLKGKCIEDLSVNY